MEGAPNGTPVVKVHATDEDKGVNGQVKYSIVRQPNQKGVKFTVNEETGEVFTNKVSKMAVQCSKYTAQIIRLLTLLRMKFSARYLIVKGTMENLSRWQ